ncbi:HAMP domain-containing histidine kinase [bacterium]|nr:HAMP domain-containing histidine kinase [bacterium]
MEKTFETTNSIINENERIIANILHDIKSPLYSIKIALQNKQDNELNKDIFETILYSLKYIEEFLVEYNFKNGKFQDKTTICDIKDIINKIIQNYKYIFINKNICIDLYSDKKSYCINSIPIFLTSILGNIISNIAFHAKERTNAKIELFKKGNCVYVEFENAYDKMETNSELGLNFCRKLAQNCDIDFKFTRTKDNVRVNLKIPELNR